MKKTLLGISMLTLTCLYGFLCAITILITLIFGIEPNGIIISCLIVLLLQFIISPLITDFTMKYFYKVKFGVMIPENIQIYIETLSKKYNIKTPKIGIIEDGGPNAFTYGRGKNDARIVLTRGLFNVLNNEEVEAVIAHEMGHIIHLDMLFMTIAQAVPLILYAIYETFIDVDNSDSDSKATVALAAVAYVLYVISQYVILYLSRIREYYADSFSVEETRNPNALAEALVKIGFGLSLGGKEKQKHNLHKNAYLGISDSKNTKSIAITSLNTDGTLSKEKIKNSMAWEMWNPWAKWYEFLSTHPLISKRLIAISKRSEEFGQIPYIKFDLKQKESYVDDFLFEVFLSFLPIMIFVLGVPISIIFHNWHIFALSAILSIIISLLKYIRAHKKTFSQTKIEELLKEPKVSHMTTIPCILEGNLVGRGDPGCIFNEDFILKDESGIIFLDYNQPLHLINKVFALFKSNEYIGKKVTIKGWYKRSPVPFIELYEINIEGKIKKIHTYTFTLAFYTITIIILMFFIFS